MVQCGRSLRARASSKRFNARPRNWITLSSFNIGHPIAFEFANRLGAILPDGIGPHVLHQYGSESVETALKIALAYQKARGKGGKYRLIGRERGYHGTNFGGISVGGIVQQPA